MFDSKSHTFVICAYKESPFLEECINSVLNQKVKTNVILATSTPNDYIKKICEKYNLTMYINEGESGITQDWNFAISKCETPIVTVAHQDDLYFEDYTENIIKYGNQVKKPLIYFCNYCEIRSGERVEDNKLLKVKRILLFPLKGKVFWGNRWVRRRSLSLGSAICCPSVAFFVDNLEMPIFNNHFRADEDWEAWEKISKYKGQFIYDKFIRMGHRIHTDSETSAIIKDSGRYEEDLEMFKKFWPDFIAKKICKAYQKSEDSNSL